MPLELGIFMGCNEFGNKPHSMKRYVILDSEPFRYQAFVSDLGGQDIKVHQNTTEGMITCIREWLGNKKKNLALPHSSYFIDEYQKFQTALPELCSVNRWTPEELSFNEYSSLASLWVNTDNEPNSY
jgi:hypothetical protein